VGLHSSWLYGLDPWNGDQRALMSIDGGVAQVHARSHAINPWKIPTGANRGQIRMLEPLRRFDAADHELLAANDINYYLPTTTHGTILWEQRTLYGNEAARTSRQHVRKLYNYLKRIMYDSLLTQAFEEVTQDELDDFADDTRRVLRGIKSEGGIRFFDVEADIGGNNTNESLANREFRVDAYIDAGRGAEHLKFGIISTDFGLRFDEENFS